MNNKELTELGKEEKMKPNDLNYLKLVRDMNDMLENDFCMDMDCKLHLHGGRDKNSFTQEEAQQMADLIGKLYTLSHYWYCHCGLGKGYELTKTTPSNDEIKREVGSIYGIPIKTFDPNNLLDEMKKAKDGTVFVIGENVIKHHEGEDTVEVVMCQVFRGKDETPPKGKQ